MEMAAMAEAPQVLKDLTLQLWGLQDAAAAAAKTQEVLNAKNSLMLRIYGAQATLATQQGQEADAEAAQLAALTLQRSLERIEIAKVDESLLPLVDKLYKLEDASTAAAKATAAQQAVAAKAEASLASFRSIQMRVYSAQEEIARVVGNTAAAQEAAMTKLGLQRQMEEEQLVKIDRSLVPMLRKLWALTG